MLDWLYTAISWVLLRWHDLFSTFLDPDGGLNWALSIVFLVVTIRLLLFRFFVKQVHTQRAMQELQPQIQALKQKYKNDRQALGREVLKLQQEAGVNPLSGCLPVLLQAPVFLALFHVLRRLRPDAQALYGWTEDQTISASEAKLFGAPISASFWTDSGALQELDAHPSTVRIVTALFIVLMTVATFITQKQILSRTRGTVQLEGPQASIQKFMLYGIPAGLFISGFFFPLGVLCYWLTTNLWTMGQQFYIIKWLPHKASTAAERPAADAKTLAPKPGAKPMRPKARRSGTPNVTMSEDSAGQTGSSENGSGSSHATPSRPRPAKRPPSGRPKKKRR